MNPFDIFDLTGRVALITGGGSGIGRGCAEILASAGAKVMVVGRRMNKLEEVRTDIQNAGGTCACFSADLTDEENCKAMVEACIQVFGRLDILVNSAGTKGSNGSLEAEFSTVNLRDTMAADFDSTFNAIKYAYPECAKNGGGSIINIASLAALRASGPVVYSAAKGAIRSMSRTLSKRLGDQKIRVNTIYPGFILTEMTAGAKDHPEILEKYADESPIHMIGEAMDIGWCALYLASDAARFVTGQDFVVDGGATA